MPPFIYINGYPGVGKLTIAKELSNLIPKSKVVSNHLLIDPAAALFDRGAEGYQPLRRALRREVLNAIVAAKSTQDMTWIFTDSSSLSHLGSYAAKDYEEAARRRGSPFISVVLHCQLEENLLRAAGEGRSVGDMKLTDLSVLRTIREAEDIYGFGGDRELELDVTQLGPGEAAARIFEYLCGLDFGTGGGV